MNWEYSVELISFIDIAVASKALNKWGRDGWEVAAIIPGCRNSQKARRKIKMSNYPPPPFNIRDLASQGASAAPFPRSLG
jgi:hypothetical protein